MQQEQKKSPEEDQALGRSRGGLSTKIHAAVDGLGKPARLLLTGGEAHDVTKANELISEHDAENIIADKAYDSDELVTNIESTGAKVVIPPRSSRLNPREYDKEDYKTRNIIERFFNRVKHCRRAATRYEKTARNFLGILDVCVNCFAAENKCEHDLVLRPLKPSTKSRTRSCSNAGKAFAAYLNYVLVAGQNLIVRVRCAAIAAERDNRA